MNSKIDCYPQGPVAILWDIENCCVPSDVWPGDVADNIRMALSLHPITQGAPVTLFSAYGNFSFIPRHVREGCQGTGLELVDVPIRKQDAADMIIVVDMFLFALDNPPPATIVLISGDGDFSPSLRQLRQRGYTVVVVVSDAGWASHDLCNAGTFCWHWRSVARGEGYVTEGDASLFHVDETSDSIYGHDFKIKIDSLSTGKKIKFEDDSPERSTVDDASPGAVVDSGIYITEGDASPFHVDETNIEEETSDSIYGHEFKFKIDSLNTGKKIKFEDDSPERGTVYLNARKKIKFEDDSSEGSTVDGASPGAVADSGIYIMGVSINRVAA